MIKVTLNNYELYAIDYLEGRLKGEDLSAFNLFLNNHPEISEELNSVGDIGSANVENKAEFGDKTPLKKEALLSDDINPDNYQTYFVAYHEGDLGDKTKENIHAFIAAHPDTTKEFESFAKLRFTPDESLRFPLKKQIKKSTPVLLLYRTLRIAASVIILLGAAWYLMQLTKKEAVYSERTNPTEIKKENTPDQKLNPIENPENKFVLKSTDSEHNLASEMGTPKKGDAIDYLEKTDEPGAKNRVAELKPASVSTIKITFEQRLNSDLKYKKASEPEEVIAEDKSVIKLKLPKFIRHKKEVSNEDNDVLAKVKIGKKGEKPNRVNYVDLGPLKVYKKKNITASSSNISGK